jgi:hypothetical protein
MAAFLQHRQGKWLNSDMRRFRDRGGEANAAVIVSRDDGAADSQEVGGGDTGAAMDARRRAAPRPRRNQKNHVCESRRLASRSRQCGQPAEQAIERGTQDVGRIRRA